MSAVTIEAAHQPRERLTTCNGIGCKRKTRNVHRVCWWCHQGYSKIHRTAPTLSAVCDRCFADPDNVVWPERVTA